MKKREVWAEIDRGRSELIGVLETLSPEQWRAPSWCARWTVRDVAAHLAIAPTLGWGEMFREARKARGNFDRMIRDTALHRAAARDDAQILDDLRGIVGSRRLAPTTFVRDPLVDTLVHTQDIARPLRIDVPVPPGPAVEALQWLWRRRFPFFPARVFAGRRVVAADAHWTHGKGDALVAPAGELLLMATGRLPVPFR